MTSEQADAVKDDSETTRIDELYRELREQILDGLLPAGTAISQVKLADGFGVSRGLLREALRMLQRENLVEAQFNRRVRVARLTTTNLEGLYAERIVIETLGVRLTVADLSSSDIKELHRLMRSMDGLFKERRFEEWEQANRAFHALLISRAGDHLIARADQLMHLARRYRQALASVDRDLGGFVQGSEDHRRIVDACEGKDPELAAGMTARHLARTALNAISVRDPAHDPVAIREALLMVGAPR